MPAIKLSKQAEAIQPEEGFLFFISPVMFEPVSLKDIQVMQPDDDKYNDEFSMRSLYVDMQKRYSEQIRIEALNTPAINNKYQPGGMKQSDLTIDDT